MDFNNAICSGTLAVINELYSQFESKYDLAQDDYLKVKQYLKEIPKELANGSYSNKDLPNESQFDSTIIDLVKLAQVYEDSGINFGGLGELGIAAAMSGVSFDLSSGNVTEAPEWLVTQLLDNIDNIIRLKLGNIISNNIVNLIKSMETLENDFSLAQIQSIIIQSDILAEQCQSLSGYPTSNIIMLQLNSVGLTKTISVDLSIISNDIDPNPDTNYFDSSFLKKIEGLKLAYRIVRNIILTATKNDPNSYWQSQRINAVNDFSIN